MFVCFSAKILYARVNGDGEEKDALLHCDRNGAFLLPILKTETERTNKPSADNHVAV